MSKSLASNFGFLAEHDPQLVRLRMLAERYFAEDPNTALLKVRLAWFARYARREPGTVPVSGWQDSVKLKLLTIRAMSMLAGSKAANCTGCTGEHS